VTLSVVPIVSEPEPPELVFAPPAQPARTNAVAAKAAETARSRLPWNLEDFIT
jgi:hypothetical protein